MIEAPGTVHIEVDDHCLEYGDRCSEYTCPIALAAEEHLENHQAYPLAGTDWYVRVTPFRLHYYHPYGELPDIVYELPAEAVDFISLFDHGLEVKPFVFEAVRVDGEEPQWHIPDEPETE